MACQLYYYEYPILSELTDWQPVAFYFPSASNWVVSVNYKGSGTSPVTQNYVELDSGTTTMNVIDNTGDQYILFTFGSDSIDGYPTVDYISSNNPINPSSVSPPVVLNTFTQTGLSPNSENNLLNPPVLYSSYCCGSTTNQGSCPTNSFVYSFASTEASVYTVQLLQFINNPTIWVGVVYSNYETQQQQQLSVDTLVIGQNVSNPFTTATGGTGSFTVNLPNPVPSSGPGLSNISLTVTTSTPFSNPGTPTNYADLPNWFLNVPALIEGAGIWCCVKGSESASSRRSGLYDGWGSFSTAPLPTICHKKPPKPPTPPPHPPTPPQPSSSDRGLIIGIILFLLIVIIFVVLFSKKGKRRSKQ